MSIWKTFVAAHDTATLEGFVVELRGKFAIKDLGDANFCKECHITRSREEGIIKFDQHLYVKTVAERDKVAQTSVIPAAPEGCLCRRRRTLRQRRRWQKCEVFGIEKQ